jgi:integrase
MGRKPSRWSNLPKGMRARPRGNLVHYYLDTGERPRREIPLGSDYLLAVKKWAELTSSSKPPAGEITFPYIAQKYRLEAMRKKASRTQKDNETELEWLLKFFGDPPAPLESIEPQHIRQYMRWRVKESRALAEKKNAARKKAGRAELAVPADLGEVRANREKALFSHIWNFARAEGFTKQPNPCAGIKGFTEEGRDTAPDAELVGLVLEHATKPLELAMRLADCIGQRPGDVLRVSENSIAGEVPGGILHVKQGKTGQKLRIMIEGELATIIQDARAWKQEVKRKLEAKKGIALFSMPAALILNERGEPLTAAMLRDRFDDARARAGVAKPLFQFRDLRAKVATETDEEGGTRAAQAILGHTTESMTEQYIRHKVGRKVRPLK